jgi:hypothetical protein
MSWPAPYFALDTTPSNTLKLISSFKPVTLSTESKGELKNGTILIGQGSFWFKKEEGTLLRLVTLWPRTPELHASIIRLHPRIELFLEMYSKTPEFILYFNDQKSAQLAFGIMLEAEKFPPPPPLYRSLPPAKPAIKGVAYIEQEQSKKIEKESRLTTEAFSDLNELMSRAGDVMDLVKRCAETLSSSHKDIDAFDALLAEIGIVDNPVTKGTAGKKYHQELAIQVSSFISKRDPPSVVITLPDVYALYNRARGGAGLVSPSDLLAACHVMKDLQLDFEFIEYSSGVLALRNKKFFLQISQACTKLLQGPTKSLSASELSKAVTGLPLLVAKEWLTERESASELVRDKDKYGNIRWFTNLFFK